MYRTSLHTPIGWMNIETSDWAVIGVYFTPHPYDELSDHPLLSETRSQLQSFFNGNLKKFNLPMEPAGTVWQRQVWEALDGIPYGQTLSYGGLAQRMGNAKVRAVASAVAANPLALLVPCHRIIGSNGQLTGYAWGIPKKEWLLQMESRNTQPSLF